LSLVPLCSRSSPTERAAVYQSRYDLAVKATISKYKKKLPTESLQIHLCIILPHITTLHNHSSWYTDTQHYLNSLNWASNLSFRGVVLSSDSSKWFDKVWCLIHTENCQANFDLNFIGSVCNTGRWQRNLPNFWNQLILQ
jgi:hypothetical protein